MQLKLTITNRSAWYIEKYQNICKAMNKLFESLDCKIYFCNFFLPLIFMNIFWMFYYIRKGQKVHRFVHHLFTESLLYYAAEYSFKYQNTLFLSLIHYYPFAHKLIFIQDTAKDKDLQSKHIKQWRTISLRRNVLNF